MLLLFGVIICVMARGFYDVCRCVFLTCIYRRRRKLKPFSFHIKTVPLRVTRCSICLETLHPRFLELACTHHFHSKCIETWLKNNTTCPLCRCSIVWHSWFRSLTHTALFCQSTLNWTLLCTPAWRHKIDWDCTDRLCRDRSIHYQECYRHGEYIEGYLYTPA